MQRDVLVQYISDIRELTVGKGFPFADRGDVTLRGFENRVRLFGVRWEG